MLKKSVAFATLVALSSPISAVSEGSTPAPIVVGIHVSATQFYARNFSETSHVLLFESSGTLIWRTLHSGCDLSWEFPAHLLADTHLEVAAWVGGAWQRTGMIDLESLATRGTEALWVQGDSSSTSWAELGAALFIEETGESLFPSTLPGDSSAGSSEETSLLAPTHVPVITPSGTNNGDCPPEIEERPLPPV
jgi:hypothetical protein